MKIAIDLTALYNRKLTGVENYGIELYHALLAKKIEVFPIFRVKNTIDNNQNSIIINNENRLLVENVLLSMKLRKLKIDIAIFPIFPPPFDIYFGSNIKIITTIHDLAFKYYASTLSIKARLYTKPKLHWALKHSDKIITISDSVKLEITNNSNVETLNLGENISPIYRDITRKIDETILEKWTLEPLKYFISVSTIEPRKNFKYLLRIFKEYIKTNPFVKIVLVGRRGWGDDAELGKLIKELDNYIIFTGYITDNELINLYYFSKAFLLLSVYEGFGRTPLEALSCDAQVFVSDIPIFRETLGSNAIFLPLDNAERCSQIIAGHNFEERKTISKDIIPFEILKSNLDKYDLFKF